MSEITASPRGYPLPHPDNNARNDALGIRAAIEKIDTEITAQEQALTTHATTTQSALNTKADAATVQEALDTKADAATTQEALDTKADAAAMQEALDTKADATSVENNLMPPGAVAYFCTADAPAGWLKADGAAVSRETYAALFAAIGTAFGEGDDSATFNLPDLRGAFVRSLDAGKGLDQDRTLGSPQDDQLQDFVIGTTKATGTAGRQKLKLFEGRNVTTAAYTTWNTVFVGQNNDFNADARADFGPIAGQHGAPRLGAETRPVNIALLACIKY